MAGHHLERFFHPRAIAVIGASDRPHSIGQRVLANLREGGFEGRVFPVNPRHDEVQGLPCLHHIARLPEKVDVAVVSTPARTLPTVLRECGEAGVTGVIVHSTGVERGSTLEQRVLETVRRYGIRMIGPNCLGIMRPQAGLNATFSRNRAETGRLALVSQSGALMAATLDWAAEQRIGFSLAASLGNASDIDFGDVLDYLAIDGRTESILLYLEGIRNPRRFMSGLRAAARAKPVIVVKSGRFRQSAPAALSHAGALIGADEVFDAAIARAGAIRVERMDQLFSCAQILPARERMRGSRLGMVTDGGGPAVIATDRAVERGLKLAELSPATVKRLDETLPRQWSRQNPVDLLEDATPERYRHAIEACLTDDGIDLLLVMLAPQALTDPTAIARTVIRAVGDARKPVAVCWMGEAQVREARRALLEGGLPQFETPEAAVDAVAALSRHRTNQALLLQVPGASAFHRPPNTDEARDVIDAALADERTLLSAQESKAVLRSVGVPVNRGVEAHTAAEALAAADSIGYPVAMKISSPDITHKSDVGGVRLGIDDGHGVETAFRTLMTGAARAAPDAHLLGVTVEAMAGGKTSRELLVGVASDPVFGPVLTLGAGGTLVDLLRDRAVALPPLNPMIADDLIRRSGLARLMETRRGEPGISREAVMDVLLKVSNLICAVPEIRELDINPLTVDPERSLALDARVVIGEVRPNAGRYSHLAIHPYPVDLIRSARLADGTPFTIRPIRPEDAELEQRFVGAMSPESRYFRFMETMDRLTPSMLARFTQIDYDRELALVAVLLDGDRETEEMGVVRYTIDPDERGCEFAIAIADNWHRHGLASRLMEELMTCARTRGLAHIHGEVLAANVGMLRLMRHLGFTISTDPEDHGVKRVVRAL